MKGRKIKTFCLLGLMVLLFHTRGFGEGDGDETLVWEKFKDTFVAVDKTWNIEFNKSIEPAQTEESVYILDKYNNEHHINIHIKDNILKVQPIENYEPGKGYRLIIEGKFKSGDGETLNRKIIVPFNVEDNITNAEKDIKSAIYNLEDSITVSKYHIGKDQIQNIMENVINSSPDVFYYNGISYTVNLNSGNVYELNFNYAYSKSEIERMREEITDKINYVMSNVIKEDMSVFEKELAIHDFIVNNTSYDIDNLKNDTLEKEAYEMYGLLVNKKAVCQGYAKTMQYLLNKVGIENTLVFGEAEGQSHVWNQVVINGERYHVDATFDDPVTKGSEVLRRSYFNVNDEIISRNHKWDRETIEKAVSMEENYFVKNGLFAESESEAVKIMKDNMGVNKSVSLMYKTHKDNIIKFIRKSGYTGSVTYSYDETTYVLQVDFK